MQARVELVPLHRWVQCSMLPEDLAVAACALLSWAMLGVLVWADQALTWLAAAVQWYHWLDALTRLARYPDLGGTGALTRALLESLTRVVLHALTWALPESLTRVVLHALTWALPESLTRAVLHALTWALPESLTRVVLHALTWALLESLTRVVLHALTWALLESLTRALLESLIRALLESLTRVVLHALTWAAERPAGYVNRRADCVPGG